MPFLLAPLLVIAFVVIVIVVRRLSEPTEWVVSHRGRLCSREEAEIEFWHNY